MDPYASSTGRPSREQQALDDLLARVNCTDRRAPAKETAAIEETLRRSRVLSAVTCLGLFL
ncbi:hypothetical protein [Streptomyces sp. NPDC049813]|uniref:hypothetical protein n=1 Tax=Streptomyces sp. NPDC049813 TaxID=3365597 RepID=UPI00379B2F36